MAMHSRLRIGAVAALASGALVLSGCAGGLGGGSSSGGETGGSTGDAIKIGFVTPQTGGLAAFGEADTFVVDQMKAYFADNPVVTSDGVSHPVEIIVKDTGSDGTAAANAASDLILNDGVSILLAGSTPDNTNPVSDQCEANQVLCITTVAPWQSWAGRDGGDPGQADFTYTYHFFWGLEDALRVYNAIWEATAAPDAPVGLLLSNDPDGNAWRNPDVGVPPFVTSVGRTPIVTGTFDPGTTNFSAQIDELKAGNAQILSGNMIPPDFISFWQQAVTAGYHPTTVTFAKAILFPSVLEALGDTGNNLSTEVWWAPTYPYSSGLTGLSAQEFADSYTDETGQQWTQPLGFVEALFEVAVAVLEQSPSLSSDDLAATMSTLKVDTIAGPIDWGTGPVPNVAKTPLTGGQWRLQDDGSYDLVIVVNPDEEQIPLGGEPEPIAW